MKKVAKFISIFFIILGCTFLFISFNVKNNNEDPKSVSEVKTVFLSLGTILLASGGTVCIINKVKEVRKKHIKETGNRIDANIDKIEKDLLTTYMNKHPYILISYYIDSITGEKYVFKSEPIWFDIATLVEVYNIKTVPVYYRNNNYKDYYVDIDEFQMYDNGKNYK